MNELHQQASTLLDEKYYPPVHSAAAALRAKTGETFVATNIDHFSGFVCAETAALSAAINSGVYEFEQIVAVRKNKEKITIVANMCGKCRQIFHDYAPGVQVMMDDGELKTIEQILPNAFMRQREKIQDVLGSSK